MDNENTQLKKDLKLIAKLDDKMNYSNVKETSTISSTLKEKKVLKTSVGSKYINYLVEASTTGMSDKCIICKGIHKDNSVFCEKCYNKCKDILSEADNANVTNTDINREEIIENEQPKEGSQNPIILKESRHCEKCGNEIEENQMFCPKCGFPVKISCKKCGTQLKSSQEYCHKCGQKNKYYVVSEKGRISVKGNHMKKVFVGLVAVLITVAIVVSAIKVLPKLFLTTEKCVQIGELEKGWKKAKNDEDKQLVIDAYLEKGEYKQAYDKALSEKEKTEIAIENAVAVKCEDIVNSLNDPDSFLLRDIFYYDYADAETDVSPSLVLQVTGSNKLGAKTSNIWLYSYSTDKKEWVLNITVNDLDVEKINRYDDEDEMLDKLVDNVGKLLIEDVVKKGVKLDKKSVKRINGLFKADKLDSVESLDVDFSSPESIA